MIDMMNVEYPVKIMRKFAKMPDVVLLHRGVDEETFNRDKPIPYIQINKIRSSYNTLISIAGADTIREVERAIFNDANIVVVWREFYQSSVLLRSSRQAPAMLRCSSDRNPIRRVT